MHATEKEWEIVSPKLEQIPVNSTRSNKTRLDKLNESIAGIRVSQRNMKEGPKYQLLDRHKPILSLFHWNRSMLRYPFYFCFLLFVFCLNVMAI